MPNCAPGNGLPVNKHWSYCRFTIRSTFVPVAAFTTAGLLPKSGPAAGAAAADGLAPATTATRPATATSTAARNGCLLIFIELVPTSLSEDGRTTTPPPSWQAAARWFVAGRVVNQYSHDHDGSSHCCQREGVTSLGPSKWCHPIHPGQYRTNSPTFPKRLPILGHALPTRRRSAERRNGGTLR